MGSDIFSLPILKAMDERKTTTAAQIAAVVTQPDGPSRRGRRPAANPVKFFADTHNIPVLQPQKLRENENVEALRALRVDLIVLASYGQILPQDVLDLPKWGCLNLHPSLLPKYRGASPIAGAILDGVEFTGTTLMRMVRRMDAGPILAQRQVDILAEDTRTDLEARLAEASADLLIASLPAWFQGLLPEREQLESEATYTERLTKQSGEIRWTEPAETIARAVRAHNPWPGAFTYWGRDSLRILRATAGPGHADPGTVVDLAPDVAHDQHVLRIGTGQGLLHVQELQRSGAKALPADVFFRGARGLGGAHLGPMTP